MSGLLLLIVSLWRRRWVLSLLLAVVLVLTVLYAERLATMFDELGSDSFREASSFNLREAAFYLSTLAAHLEPGVQWGVLGVALGITAAVCAMAWLAARLAARPQAARVIVMLAGVVLVAAGLSTSLRVAYAEFTSSATAFARQERKFAFTTPIGVSKADSQSLTILLYVGESTSALNLQLYGYPRATTPHLVALANADPGMIVFDKMFSTHVHTSLSLMEAFSMRPADQSNKVPIDEQRRLSVIDALAAWGIRVALYSNQSRTGSYNYASSIVFRAADRHFSVDEPIGNLEIEDRPLDGAYLPLALHDKAFSDDSTSLVIFHSYAGHGDYLDYIPAGTPTPRWLAPPAQPTDSADSAAVDRYDTALSYVDLNLSTAIESAAAAAKPVIFVYFSHHGESPTLDTGHDSSRFRVEMARIPFIVYFNAAARRAFPDRFARMKQLAAARNISTLAQLVPTLLELMGLTIDSKAGLDLPPPVGSRWEPAPILVRRTPKGVSYLRFKALLEIVNASLVKQPGTPDGRRTCFSPDIPRPDVAPKPQQSDCIVLETVRQAQQGN